MESNEMRNLLFAEPDIDLKVDETKNIRDRPESPEECVRPETPSSTASTSGFCSMASSDFEPPEENPKEKVDNVEEITVECPIIIYQKRDILNVFENIYPFSIYQTTYVPKMNMSNYWERRSVYHRLGPFGRMDELDFQKCHFCDFYTTVPKRI